jgi:hypothetical protein
MINKINTEVKGSKDKILNMFNETPCHENSREVDVQLHAFLTSALHVIGGQLHGLPSLIPHGVLPRTHWIQDLISHGVGLVMVMKKQLSSSSEIKYKSNNVSHR